MTTRRRVLYLTTDDGKTCEIDVVPDASNPASKRLPGIRDQETRLQKELLHLEDGTRAKNKQFEEQLDAISRQAATWREKLDRECAEAKDAIEQLQANCDIAAKEILQSLDDYLHEKFNVVPTQLIPPRLKQLDNMTADTSDFFKRQVPELVESQTGAVTRRLMKANETFDIEKQKDEKRETKIVAQANAHIQRTAQRLLDEHTVTLAKQMLLEESIVEAERSAARMLEIRTSKASKAIVDLRYKVREESVVREREDQIVLDTVLETQEKLQQTVLEHFGRQRQEDTEEEEKRSTELEDEQKDLDDSMQVTGADTAA